MNLYQSLILSVVTLTFVSCGGGSTSKEPEKIIPPTNSSPYKIIVLGVGYASDINENGYVVGSSDGIAYIYDGVTKNDIGTYGTGIISPSAINNNNGVVANYKTPSTTIFTDVVM